MFYFYLYANFFYTYICGELGIYGSIVGLLVAKLWYDPSPISITFLKSNSLTANVVALVVFLLLARTSLYVLSWLINYTREFGSLMQIQVDGEGLWQIRI